MLPQFLPHYSVGPFFGLAANAVMAILCFVILALYRHYRPLRSLFFFYLFSTLFFLGGVIYGLQRSPESILLGYRIDLAALALLAATWVWFISALFNERPGWLSWTVTAISLSLAALALLGQGPYFLGLPLETHQIAADILRPQSKLLRPLIHFFCLVVCLSYFFRITVRLWRFKGHRPVYLLPVGFGLLFWLLGGLHDAIRSTGVAILIKTQVLWFTSFWLTIFLTLAITLHFRSLAEAVREARDVFERFVPPAYLRRIATEGLGSIRLGEADQQCVTILYCDVRGFTSLSEKLNPSQLVAFINRLLERINPLVSGRQGVIDKFLGDGVLCIFEGADSAERAVACGVEMLAAVKSLNAEKDRPTDQAVQIGIGLHTGPVILGTIGSSDRMDSTVLGLTVNLAKRLEEATKPLGVDMLISEEVANRLPNGHAHRFRKLGEISVKGSSAPVAVVEVYDQDSPEVRNLKDRIEPIMAEGIVLFRDGRFDAALSKFEEAQPIFPQDLPLNLLITSLRHALKQGRAVKGSALLSLK
jgi:class 3 adenylate cyclase